ncbi:hypothetical protein PVAP13_3KG250027 [Panicum virgatum]|uniref:Protein FAR1-RELATED SEQUENCE n=1 Tax=Panicum virgatum TaxID=38727 RepID=A0A8T0V5E5_PANVG|nr:hypothetical protein PVAP13_3KG250027 [Panicum virgatum]
MVSLSSVAAPTTTPAATQAPAQNSGAESADPLHHVTMLTPPAALPPGALQTLDAAQVVYPKGEEPNKTEKGSKRCGCPKVKHDKKRGLWYFDHVQQAHNHKLEQSPRMTRYMHAHKNMEKGMCDIFNIMTRNEVPRQAALNVMADLYDGRHMWGFTEKDIKNMNAEKARKERDDDLNKLLQFFRECKENNKHFYWDVDADPKTGALIGDESTRSFRWLFETFNSCMGGRQPHWLLPDEDPAMRQAIKVVFDKTHHRNCRWHILRLWEFELDQLYIQHKDMKLKEKLESLINYPLGPTQFEVEWKRLVDECGIADHPAIKALWEQKERWIATYFKGMYCGRMTSTQRLESQNKMLNDGYVNESTGLHIFAKWMLDSLQHADHMDAGETHYAQFEVVRACKAKFDEQLSRVYTKAVYQKYKKQYNNNTAFVIEPDADSRVRRILERYVLKRHTRDAREEVTWDRHDGVRIGAQASKDQCRMLKLLPKLIRLGRAGSKSDHAFEKANRQLDKITPSIELFPTSTDDESPAPAPSASGSVAPSSSADTNSPPSSTLMHAGVLLIEPPVSRTKGRRPGKQKKNDVQPPLNGTPLSTYTRVNYGDRQCSICGVQCTHYSTTCLMNPDRSKSAEIRAPRKSSKKNDGPPR